MNNRNCAAHGATDTRRPYARKGAQLVSSLLDTPKRAALYPRVSSDKQVRDGYGLSYQERELRQFAETRGYSVVEVVSEPGVSRTEFNRPGLDRLRELARTGKIDAVLAWKRDRYFGDPGLRVMFEREMELYGMRQLAMDASGGDRPEDKFSDGIKDLLAQLEVAKTRERTVSSTLQKVREGKVIVGRRINYGFNANTTRDQYELEEGSAEIVGRIFQMVGAEGYSINGVSDALNAEGIPSPTGTYWSRTQVRQIILEDIYKPHSLEELRAFGVAEPVLATLDSNKRYGVWFYNRRSMRKWRDPVTFENSTKTTEHPREAWVAVPVPDIGVPRAVVDQARERIKNNVRTSRASGRVWELDSGVLRCGSCGRALVPRTTPNRGKPRYWYICGSYSVKPRPCPGVFHYRAEPLEAEVAAKLDEWFGDPDRTTRYIMERLEAQRRKLTSGDPATQAKALSERIAKLDRMKANYRRQQAEDMISMAELKAVLSDLDAQRRTAKVELDNTLNRAERISELETEAKSALDMFAALASMGLEHLTPEMRKGSYRKLHLKVTVEPDGTLTIAGEPDANYLPEPNEIDEATRDEARRIDEVIQRLR